MSYKSVKMFEMQATKDKPYMCEFKPAMINYLERALSGRMSQSELEETGLPQVQLDALTEINSTCKYSNQMVSYKVQPEVVDCEIVLVKNVDGVKVETVVVNEVLKSKMNIFLSALGEVMKNYIASILEAIRSKPGIKVNAATHNQFRYMQIAYATNQNSFNVKELCDIDLYTYITCASLENVMIMQPFIPKTSICKFLRMVNYKTGEIVTYNTQSVGLLSKRIMPPNGCRLRLMVRGERAEQSRDVSLDFLDEEEEF